MEMPERKALIQLDLPKMSVPKSGLAVEREERGVPGTGQPEPRVGVSFLQKFKHYNVPVQVERSKGSQIHDA
jgi:hypothetical protein